MNLLLIPDKFKGSLSATEVIKAVSIGVQKIIPSATIHNIIASDGGDGFLTSVSKYDQVERVNVSTFDPLGRTIMAPYCYQEESATAYIEMANTSGMVLLNAEERNPLACSTYGTGVLLKHALDKGARHVYIGLGGSATNDGGIGIAKALGYSFFDITGNELNPIGESLLRIDRIQPPDISNLLKDTSIYAVNDVNNPLYGENGAARVYAAQKGASPEDIEVLDRGLEHLHKLVAHQFNVAHADLPGAGAAGGTAYGLKAFAGADFISGIDFILDLAKVDDLIKARQIDYIITGEGKIDDQTLSGKLISGVMALGQRYSIPVVAICGALEADKNTLEAQGLHAVIEVRNKDQSLEYNMKNAFELVVAATSSFFKQI